MFALPDPRCTPGALNPAVTASTLASTICRSGYSSTIRPAASVTRPEKIASLNAYGDPDQPSVFEYDHLISLELGGAANDPRNLWPEPGASPNPKDRLENRLHALICSGQLSLVAAQRAIATDWVSAYRTYVSGTQAATVVLAPLPQVRATTTTAVTNAAPAGATARCTDGTYSYAAHHQGACSHHGGVAVFYR